MVKLQHHPCEMLLLLMASFAVDSFGFKSFRSLLPLPLVGSLRMETVVFDGGLPTLCFPVLVSLKRRISLQIVPES